MASGIVGKKEINLRENYQKYLDTVGVQKNAMSYYQWLNRDKPQPTPSYSQTPQQSERTVPSYSVTEHRAAEKRSLENALDSEEIKRYNRDNLKRKGTCKAGSLKRVPQDTEEDIDSGETYA